MLTRSGYRLPEFLVWTRRTIYVLVVVSVVPVVLYQVVGWRWLLIPFSIVFLLGTTVALSAGFKNLQTYNRMQEAQQVWSSIASSSRSFGVLCRELCTDRDDARVLLYGHFAWLTALRHEMRRRQPWETQDKVHNAEYQQRHYTIPERNQTLIIDLARYLPSEDAAQVLMSRSAPLQALALQSRNAKRLLDSGAITPGGYADLQKLIRDFHDQQGRTERIKDFPYPRQHAFINSLFVKILALLLPLGMMSEFERLNDMVAGPMRGHMVWFAIPLSLLISWMYMSLDQVGSSTENPFEGGANDVPITTICEEIEVDLREMLGEVGVPAVPGAQDGFAL